MIKLYLDDLRNTPEGWYRVYTAKGAIEMLEKSGSKISEVSLDHDLGEDESEVGTGYDVILWIEEQVFTTDYISPKISVHSANPPAKIRMENGRSRIYDKCLEKMCGIGGLDGIEKLLELYEL